MRASLHRPARAALVALASLAAILLAHARASAETYWLDGYELEVTLEPLRESFVLGEPVGVGLEFENHTETFLELMLSRAGDEAWPDDFEVTVTGLDGETLPRPDGERPAGIYQNIQLCGRRGRGLPHGRRELHSGQQAPEGLGAPALHA
jgi:hypothetical protein